MNRLIILLGLFVVISFSPVVINAATHSSTSCNVGTANEYPKYDGTPCIDDKYCPPPSAAAPTLDIKCYDASSSTLISLLSKVFTTMFVFLVTIASFTLLYAAFLYVTSEGEQEKINQAKKMIIYAVVALIVAALAFGAPRAIQSFITT